MPTIYSTASNDNSFPVYEKLVASSQTRGNVSAAVAKKHVVIRGRANVRNDKTFVTPRGVATVVTDEALACLKKDKAFMHMVENGYMFIDEKVNKKPDQKTIDSIVKAEMESKDASAQMTDADFAKLKLEGIKAPTIVDAEDELDVSDTDAEADEG